VSESTPSVEPGEPGQEPGSAGPPPPIEEIGASETSETSDEDTTAEAATPPSSDTPHGSVGRSIALGVVAFLATLLLLAGIAALVARPPGRDAATTSSAVPSAGASVPGGAPTASASQSAATPGGGAAPPGDPVLVGAGDIADCALDRGAATAALLDTIPGTVFTAGDNAYPHGTPEEYRDCYDPTWGRHRARTHPAAGNHDWETADLAGYRGYFGAAATPAGRSWYSYDLGAWHVIVLDSNCSSVGGCAPESEQGKWLASDLAASKARCTLAVWHHPRFSSGEHGNDASVAPFWRTLYDAGADIVVNGHDHDYERFAPQDPDARADDARGIREFVVGTGGAELRQFSAPRPNSVVRAAVAHGVVRFALHPSGFDWRFISTTGEFSESGTGACH
jgi:Calcineurin-like phosphoesterase